MSFKIERGLFRFEFTDHHAVLGIPVDASKGDVRKRYLKIARRLHPDSNRAASEADKEQANQILSKLVNPAYEQLSQDKGEYLLSLKHLGKRLATEGGKIPISSQTAKKLVQAGASLDNLYKSSVKNLASQQYESLTQVLDTIGEISELNLIYLRLKGGEKIGQPSRPEENVDQKQPTESKATVPSPPSLLEKHLRRAEGYLTKNNFASAVLELREALKLDPNSSSCHSLLGYAYLKQNQAAMARVHVNKALQLNPKDERALKCKKFIENMAQKSGSKSRVAPKSDGTKPPDKSGGGGLFGGIFGGKKK